MVAERRDWTSSASRQLVVVALSLGSYLFALTIGGNGFIAAFVGGLAFGVASRRRAESSVRFTESLGSLLAIGVWTIFGVTVGATLIRHGLDLRAIAYAMLSLTVIRMVPVAISSIGSRFQPLTVVFIGWFGPRGLASIVFLIIAIEGLHAAGSDTEVLTATIGWTVLLSVVLHGLSAAPLARRYGQRIAAIAGDTPEREAADEPRAAMHWASDIDRANPGGDDAHA